MMHKPLLILASALLASPAWAEPQPAVQELMHYTGGIDLCLSAAETAEDAKTCIGQSSASCMENEQGGHSTVGMMFCLLAEYHGWDRALNSTYQRVMAGLEADDAQEAEHFPEFASRAETLRTAQRAWIPFRDGQCAFEYALWGSGSFRQVSGADCLMMITAERTIYLHFAGSRLR